MAGVEARVGERGSAMNIPNRLSIHSIKRIEKAVGWLCLGFLLATFCTAVLPGLLELKIQRESGARIFPPMFPYWLISAQMILLTTMVCPRLMWAKASGMFSAQSRGSSCLSVVPWLWLYYVVLPVFWALYQPVFPLWIVLWVAPWGAALFGLLDGNEVVDNSAKLQRALSPSWPAGTLGAEPRQIGSMGGEVQIIIVREITDPGLLRVLATHQGIRSFRLLPECGFVAVLCDEYPRLHSLFPRFLKTRIDQTEFEEIGLVVNQWGARSERRWHGMLDDGTVLVHNDGETRIVPPDSEKFELYRAVLTQQGREAGLGKFYLQMQGESIVELCEVQEVESGTGASAKGTDSRA